MSASDLFLAVVALIVMFIGFLGIIIPRVPGLYLVWSSAFFYGIITHFQHVHTSYLLFTGVLVTLVYLVEWRLTRFSLREFHFSLWTLLGALVGAGIGIAFGFWVAVTVAPILGAIIAEQLIGRDTAYTVHESSYTFVGYWGVAIVRLVLAAVIMGTWYLQVF